MWTVVRDKNEDTGLRAIELGDGLTAIEIDRNVGHQNWYCSRQPTAEAAIIEARQAGFAGAALPDIPVFAVE